MSRVKIVATIGPQSNRPETIAALLRAGMNVARLNGSHADLAWHAQAIAALRAAAASMPIIFDVPGRKIRTKQLSYKPIFEAGDTVVLTADAAYSGERKVPVAHPDFHRWVAPGDVLIADDGTLPFTVLEVTGQDVVCRAHAAGSLRSAVGISMPSAEAKLAGRAERDSDMLAFAKEQGVDFIGLSFVESAADVRAVSSRIGKYGPRIISKIESRLGLDNLSKIIAASDAIMIDRGDLAAETELEGIALHQKSIINAARASGKPVIVATQILHSMIEHPVPTKAEVSDISNAVLDGVSALMLSAETAVGRFPQESVAVMRRIVDTVSESVQNSLDDEKDRRISASSVPEAMAEAIALVCRRLPITKIVAITISGFAAQAVAALRPRQPILAVTNNPVTARAANLLPGTEGVYVDVPFPKQSTDHIARCLEELWRRGKLADDDVVLVTSVGYPKSGNRMNLMQTHAVADLKETLGWAR